MKTLTSTQAVPSGFAAGPWVQALIGLGLGAGLAFALLSPAQAITVSAIGLLVYLSVVMISPLNGLLLWLIIYPFVEKAINLSLGEGVPDLSPTRFCTIFLYAMVMAQVAIGKRPAPRLDRTDFLAILFVIGIGLSGFAAPNPNRAFQRILDAFVVPLVMYFLMRSLVTDRSRLGRVMAVLLVVGTYTAAYAIYEQTTGHILFAPVEPPARTEYSESIRILRGLFGGPHIFGSLITMSLPIGIYYFLESRQKRRKLLFALVIIVMFAGLYFTFKRASWVGMLTGILVMQLFYPKFRRYFLVVAVLASALVMYSWTDIAASEVYTDRVNNRVDTLNGRTYRWEEAIEFWKQRPLAGWGYDQYSHLSEYETVESMYLNILVSAGLVGFVPFVLLLLSILMDSYELYRRSGRHPRIFIDRTLVAVFWGIFSAFLVKAATGNAGTHSAYVNIIFFLIIGAIIGSQQEILRDVRASEAEPAPARLAASPPA